jgi:hypothetical protein
MFLGHYGVALGAKRLAPRTSLGTLTFATQFLDELWPLLLLAGIEQVRIVPGLMPANPLDFTYYPFSHSLLFAVIWGVVIGAVYLAVRRYGRGAWVVGGVVISHWILDLPVHRPDLPLWPGSPVRLGAGAWNSVPLTLVLEFGVFLAGLAIYLRATRPADRIGRWALWAMVVVLAAITVANSFGPPPPSERAIAFAGLGLWLFIPWAWWIDRHRVMVPSPRV